MGVVAVAVLEMGVAAEEMSVLEFVVAVLEFSVAALTLLELAAPERGALVVLEVALLE